MLSPLSHKVPRFSSVPIKPLPSSPLISTRIEKATQDELSDDQLHLLVFFQTPRKNAWLNRYAHTYEAFAEAHKQSFTGEAINPTQLKAQFQFLLDQKLIQKVWWSVTPRYKLTPAGQQALVCEACGTFS